MSDNERLAQHLLSTGVAMSETHAREMAAEISSTGTKVKEHFKDKEEEATMTNKYREAKIREMRENALSSNPVDVRADYEIPGVSSDSTVGEIVSGAAAVEEQAEVEEEEVSEPEHAEAPEAGVDINDIFNFGR